MSAAAALDQADPAALVRRFNASMAAGDAEAAGAAVAALDATQPGHPVLPLLRASLAEAAGDLDGACGILEVGLTAHPAAHDQRQRLLEYLQRLDKPARALAVLEEGLALAPGRPELLQAGFGLWLRTRNLAAAAAALEALPPTLPALPRLRAELLEAQGDLAAARTLREALLGIHPEDLANRLHLVALLAREGDHAAALRLADAAPGPARDSHPGLRWWRASLLRTLGEITSARDLLRAGGLPGVGERELLAHCLLDLGATEEAGALLDPWPPGADVARRRVAMRLAALRHDHAAAMAAAEALAPADPTAVQRLALSAALSFQPDRAWAALEAARLAGAPPGAADRRLQLNSLAGQWVNELRLRADATARLAAAGTGPALARVAATLLRDDPGATGAAIGLLQALARGAPPRLRPVPRAIPRVLHLFWPTPEPPPAVRRHMARLEALHPGFALRRWDGLEASAFLEDAHPPEVLDAYHEARQAPMRADILRLAVLVAQGGVWVEADAWCMAPLDALLPEGAALVVFQEEHATLGTDLLAATPGHPLLAAALREAVAAGLEGAAESAWLATGPGLLSRVVAGAMAQLEDEPALPEGVQLWPLAAVAGRLARRRPPGG